MKKKHFLTQAHADIDNGWNCRMNEVENKMHQTNGSPTLEHTVQDHQKPIRYHKWFKTASIHGRLTTN